MTLAIKMSDVTFKYDSQSEPTLHHINLNIEQGERVLLSGPSGSGKTTLGQLLNGLIPHAYQGEITGDITINGHNIKDMSIFERSFDIGTVLQDTDTQFVGLTVAEDVAFALENDNVTHNELFSKVQQWAKIMELEELLRVAPQALSGGQKQRVAMAGVLIDDSPILLFDEPLASLDPASGHRMLALLDELQEKYHLTVIMIEHRLEDVLQHRLDRVVVLDRGVVTFDGTPDEILKTQALAQYGLAMPGYLQLLKLAGVSFDGLVNITNPAQITGPDVYDKLQILENSISRQNQTGSPTAESILTIQQLTFKYGKQSLFENIDVTLYEGELVALVGKNGSGKSTLSKLIAGFIKPTAGTMTLAGVGDLSGLPIKARADYIGYVSQNPNEMITQSIIYDEVASGLRLRGMSEEELKPRVYELLKLAGLYGMREWPITVLSYGQKKRLTIIAVLALAPKILILDEPTAGQDYANAQAIMSFVKHLNKQFNTTVMVITHDMSLMLSTTDRALVLVDGQLLADLTPASLLNDPHLVEQADLSITTVYELAQQYGLSNPAALTALIGKG
ncbi:ABC transporter ATP-binding protein [Weissella sagaensis]|uniref:ABC transporter ATP-binding protein n=1 Tax=Weissella sagaensis TaxID=2559928 RepID=A0ABW1RV84_9LACO|nr:ATP-binding cassette domain-containing protein [Weissella sagaensis]KAA8434488.1 ATP-binding cassette domain-containing protein [Weissella paramesenteroides]KAA8437447.1 ATP-binding cassette domain-containing protein [Weissella paramesenteroides]QEA56927.1 ATP-binding cassette domain-containing protein [Weissella hellenica]UEG67742.1 ATP-binding cassette domain-containing protein [Weissella hellenica]